MALVGDLIIKCRAQAPDVAPTLPAPTASASVVTPSQSTLTPGIYNCIVTQRNNWGETVGSTEITNLNVSSGQGIQITSALLPGAVAIRAYLTLPGGNAGTEIQFVEGTTSPFTILSQSALLAGSPPFRSTAYMPDSDGARFGAATLYSWLNDALKKMSHITGGILDYSGVPTQAGNPLYVLPTQWKEITDVWYGGYWVQGGKRQDFFRYNTVTSSILDAVTISIHSNQMVMEVNYQPDRNSGVTSTTNAMLVTDTQVGINNTSVFQLPFGFAQIGSEIVAYSSLSGGVMGGLIRGVGSAVQPQAWQLATTVTELSLFWCGKRIYDVAYAPGQSTVVMGTPQGWENILLLYMLSQIREQEQDGQNVKRLMDQFEKDAQQWMMSNKGVVKKVQVGEANLPLVYAPTIAGGIIVP
jgi:hypothetical protein